MWISHYHRWGYIMWKAGVIYEGYLEHLSEQRNNKTSVHQHSCHCSHSYSKEISLHLLQHHIIVGNNATVWYIVSSRASKWMFAFLHCCSCNNASTHSNTLLLVNDEAFYENRTQHLSYYLLWFILHALIFTVIYDFKPSDHDISIYM